MAWNLIKAADDKQTNKQTNGILAIQSHICKQLEYKAG